MPLSTDERTALLALMPHLGPDGDEATAVRFAREHRDALLDELVAVPGFSQVRAAVLRLLPALVPDATQRQHLLGQAGSALMVPVGEDPASRLARHPAWIGLAVLELADQQDAWEGEPLDRALELAGRAFASSGMAHDLDEGEVTWAMAETADESGWTDRGDELLEEALERPFADPVHRAQVRLIVAMRRDQRGERAGTLLALVADDDEAIDRDRVHAAWVLAHVRRREGDEEGAFEALELAASHVDRDDDPGVAARIDETLAAWRA